MTRDGLPIHARFLQIGTEVVPVQGNDRSGWSLNSDGLLPGCTLRYESLDELFFVLVNMNVSPEGAA